MTREMDDTTAGLTVRPALRADMARVAAIYGHYVRTSHCTFDLRAPTVADWEQRFDDHVARGPYDLLVAEHDGRIIGYAKTGEFRNKAAYASSVEVSVYRDHDAVISGVGTRLYGVLFAGMRRVHRAYAGIALPNPASIALHERFGFTHVGTYGEVGRKFDRYWDVAWYERRIDP